MSNNKREVYTLDKIFRFFLFLGLVVTSYFLLSYLRPVLIPFAVAALLAYLLNPLVCFIQNRLKFKYRILAVLSSLVLVIAVFFGFVKFIFPLVKKEYLRAEFLFKKFVSKTENDGEPFSLLPKGIRDFAVDFVKRDEVQAWFNSDNFFDVSLSTLQNIMPSVWGIFSGTLNAILGVLGLVIILLYLVFILLDYEKVMKGWQNLIPPKYKGLIIGLVEDFRNGMNSYFRAQSSIAFTVGILFAIGFSIIGLPLGILLGLFVGLLNMVPYLQIVGFVPAALLTGLYSLDTGSSFWSMFGLVLLVFAVVQTIQETILIPKIMGNATGLNPAVILLSLSIWGKLLGILGIIIALPVTLLLLTYYRQFLKGKLIIQNSNANNYEE